MDATGERRAVSEARAVVFELLGRWREGGAYADELLDEVLSREALARQDAGLIQELFYGVLRRKLYLDFLIDRFARQGRHSLPKAVQDILRLSLYSLLYLSGVPDYATLDEACRLARTHAGARWVNLVNGILRQAQRRREALPEIPGPPDSAGHLSLRHSLPEWLVQRFLKQFGPEQTKAIGQWALARPPLTIRVNARRVSRETLLDRFAGAGVNAEAHPDSPAAIRVLSGGPLTQWPGFHEGLWQVQDASAQRIAPLLDVRPGQQVWEPCAAPGGKALQLAELLGGRGSLWTSDLSLGRLARLRDNWGRLGEKPPLLWAGDARHPPLRASVRFDRILLDVPCSGLGVLSRRVDLRWRLKEEDIGRLAELQLELLQAAAARLRPGGIIVYSTCTLTSEENEGVVERFLEQCAGFEREKITPEGDWLVLPETGLRDGLYAARLKRICGVQKRSFCDLEGERAKASLSHSTSGILPKAWAERNQGSRAYEADLD